MAITLSNITSGYNTALINANFQKVEDYINDVLLARAATGVTGEAKMARDLDMDGHSILNAFIGDIDLQNIVDTVNHSVRIPLSEPAIDPLPNADTRKGKILGFSPIDGSPTILIPSSGSAADVLMQLASSSGASMIGFGQETLATAVPRDLKYFGAVGNGTTDDTTAILAADAWSISSGKPVRVTAGNYKILNASLGGWYQFEDDAYLVGTLGATDNMVVALSGLRMENPRWKKTLSAFAVDGDYGNAIRIGTYRQANDLNVNVNNVRIYNGEVYNVGTTFTSQAIEVLGNAYDIVIDGMKIVGAGAGIICHWGGDVGTDGHSSTITYSYHPHNIALSNFYFGPDSLGNAPSNTMILSACYDVQVTNVSSLNIQRTLWIFPGDVYNEVAVARDKDKPCTGIVVNGVHIVDPIDGNAAIDIGGIPATKRTAQPTVYARDVDGNMDITVTGANITCADIVYANPNVIIRACKGVKAAINKDGGDRSSSYWAFLDYNDSCRINLSGTSTLGERLRGNTSCDITLDSQRILATALSGTDGGCSIETFNSGAFTMAAAALNATSVTVTTSADGILFNGAYLYVSGVPVARVLKSVLAPNGVATPVTITALNTAILNGTSGTVALPHTGTYIRGHKKRHLYNYRVVNGWGLKFCVSSTDAQRGGLLFSGDYVRDCSIVDSTFVGTGSEGGTSSHWDIHVTATKVRGLIVDNCNYDVDAVNPTSSARVNIVNSDHAGVIISNCRATASTGGVSFSLANSTAGVAYSIQQIYGNATGELQAPIATAVGSYLGGHYFGFVRNNATPSTGFWSAGDKLNRTTVVSGGQEGWICTTSGSPGVWNGFGAVA